MSDNVNLGDTVYVHFTTRAFGTGIPTQLAGTPALSVLESGNAVPITAGVSLSVDRAAVTGLNEGSAVASGANGYEVGKTYSFYISAGTVGGVSVVGEVLKTFTIESGTAGAIKTKTDFLPSATAGAAGGVFIAGTNAATTVTSAFTTTFTGNLTGSVASVTGAVGSVTGNVGGNVAGSVGSVTGAVGSVTGAVGSVTGAVGSVTAGVTVSTNNDKTGYSLTQAFPTNFASLGISAAGNANVDVIKINGVTVVGTGVAGDLWRA